MPLTFTPVRNEDTTAATRLLAQYMPNLGEDIYNIGSILSAEEGKTANRLQTQKTLAELQDKDQQRMDALQFQDWMTRNAEQANALMKDAFGGKYDRIYDVQLPYKIASQLRTLAGTEAKLGNESRESAAKVQENATNAQLHLANIANAGLTRAKLGLELKEAQRKEQQAQGEDTLNTWIMEHPNDADTLFSQYTSANPEEVQKATAQFGQLSGLNPLQLKIWFENLKTALPQNTIPLETYKENAQRVFDQIQNTWDNTQIEDLPITYGALTRAMTEGIPKEGLKINGQDLSAQTLKDILALPDLNDRAKEEYAALSNGTYGPFEIGKANQVSPYMTIQLIKSLMPYYISTDSWTNFFNRKDALGKNGLAIDQNRDLINYLVHGMNQAGLRKAVQTLNRVLNENPELIEAMHGKTGILSQIKPITTSQYNQGLRRYSLIKPPKSIETLRNEALPSIARIIRNANTPEEIATQLIAAFSMGLAGGKSPINFNVKRQSSSKK